MFPLFITIITLCIPLAVKRLLPSVTIPRFSRWLPIIAGCLFLLAFFIPDIHISKETETFQQHFVGGGVYCTLLYIYFQRVFGWKASFMVGIALLFAWTSAFGVANELLEFTLAKLRIVQIDTADTDWDLVANTSGSLISYLVIRLTQKTYSKIYS